MLIIFDCDGVLVDSEILAKKVELSVYGEQGFEASLEEFSERFSGMTGSEIMRDIEAVSYTHLTLPTIYSV